MFILILLNIKFLTFVYLGGGLDHENELIEVVELSMDEVDDILKQPEVNCPGGFLFALLWLKMNKLNR